MQREIYSSGDVYEDTAEQRARFERSDARQKQIEADIARGLDNIGQLTAEHMSKKGLGNGTVNRQETAGGVTHKEDNKEIQKKVSEEAKRVFEENKRVSEEAKKRFLEETVQETKVVSEVEASPQDNNTIIVTKTTTTTHTTTEKEQPVYMNTTTTTTHRASDLDGTYAALGETFKDLTAKMKDVTTELRKDEGAMPFIDERDDELTASRTRAGVTSGEDDDPELDAAIREAGGFHEDLEVDRIQLQEPGLSESEAESEQMILSPTAAVMVTERRCAGTDAVQIKGGQIIKKS